MPNDFVARFCPDYSRGLFSLGRLELCNPLLLHRTFLAHLPQSRNTLRRFESSPTRLADSQLQAAKKLRFPARYSHILGNPSSTTQLSLRMNQNASPTPSSSLPHTQMTREASKRETHLPERTAQAAWFRHLIPSNGHRLLNFCDVNGNFCNFGERKSDSSISAEHRWRMTSLFLSLRRFRRRECGESEEPVMGESHHLPHQPHQLSSAHYVLLEERRKVRRFHAVALIIRFRHPRRRQC